MKSGTETVGNLQPFLMQDTMDAKVHLHSYKTMEEKFIRDH